MKTNLDPIWDQKTDQNQIQTIHAELMIWRLSKHVVGDLIIILTKTKLSPIQNQNKSKNESKP